MESDRSPSPTATLRSKYLNPSPALITRIETVTAITTLAAEKVRLDLQEAWKRECEDSFTASCRRQAA